MRRFLTYEKNANIILCMSETEFQAFRQSDKFDEFHDWQEYVWQFAPDKQTAISQHHVKHDDWQENPNKETY